MASSLALKRLVSSRVIPSSSFLRPVATSPSSRLFNTNALRDYDDDHESDRGTDDRRSRRSLSRSRDGFLSGVFDPFSPTRSLSQVLNMMDQFMENPLISAPSVGGLRRGWDAQETDDALNLRIDMPGLGKEDIKVSVEQNSLVIKGEAEKKSDDEENARRYSSRIDLPEKMYKTDEIKAEMKNGVLKVVVPKVKEEERANVFHVKVE
ncbi:protein 23.5 KDA HEAT SHOCK PROTEIN MITOCHONDRIAL [Salix viminalis]|uniref:Protein 23.5 kDa HEAT SHOCK PROTEIN MITOCHONDRIAL n=1 Tax=Salix viminalis TaxID=40686 RepID=A0A9Q0T7F5_SALVM|nr:protein 23.5 KDA HEAT SHOCK PROTEIN MITOCHONDRIAL [Salix viminalis]